jgi:hypothetical protein
LHSHRDGIIHVEPARDADAGTHATLGRYFTYGGWTLGATGFDFLTARVRNGDRCGDNAAVVRWAVNGVEQRGDPAKYKLTDQDVIVVAFVPAGRPLAGLGKPPSVPFMSLQKSAVSKPS